MSGEHVTDRLGDLGGRAVLRLGRHQYAQFVSLAARRVLELSRWPSPFLSAAVWHLCAGPAWPIPATKAPRQLLDVVAAFLHGRRPNVRGHSVCTECKRAGITCVMVAHGTPCLGPVTQAGCGALCPSYGRGCYGCFGPMEAPNTAALSAWWQKLGVDHPDLARVFRTFNAGADAFRKESEAHDAR